MAGSNWFAPESTTQALLPEPALAMRNPLPLRRTNHQATASGSKRLLDRMIDHFAAPVERYPGPQPLTSRGAELWFITQKASTISSTEGNVHETGLAASSISRPAGPAELAEIHFTGTMLYGHVLSFIVQAQHVSVMLIFYRWASSSKNAAISLILGS